ncbi:hypothetical protein [Dysgonomonas reticulitermitis]
MEAQKNVQVYNITADGINAGMSVPQQRVPVKETPGIKTGMPERSGSGCGSLKKIFTNIFLYNI